MLRNYLLLPAAAIAAFGMIACNGDDDDDDIDGTSTTGVQTVTTGTPDGTSTGQTPSTTGTAQGGGGGDEMTVDLEGQGTDGVDGEAVFSEGAGGGTSVEVTLDDTAATGTVAIHTGTCDDPDQPAVATVGSITGGSANGDIDLTMDELESEDHVIVVLPSAGGDPVACGEI